MDRQWMKKGAALLALAALGLTAGCGGSPAKSGAASSAAPAAPAASASGKVLKVACIATYPPFVYKDKDEKIIGFDVDLTDAVAKEMGAKTEYTSMPFDQLVPALADNKADIAVAACDMTQDRAEKVNFSNIYYSKESVSILAKKDDNTIKGPEDLKDKVVAVEKGTMYVNAAQQLGAKVKEYDYHDQLLKAVASNEADALILDKPVAQYYLKHEAKDTLRQAGILSGSGGFVMLLNKKDPDLQKNVNDALSKLMSNGEYDKIYDKWFGEEKSKDEKK